MNRFWPDFTLIWNWIKIRPDFQPEIRPHQKSVKPKTDKSSLKTRSKLIEDDWMKEMETRTVTASMISDDHLTKEFQLDADDVEELHKNELERKGYQMEKKTLGTGGFGSVHKLNAINGDEEFAVKIIYLLPKSKRNKVSLNPNQAIIERNNKLFKSFKNEIITLSKLSHKNIIGMHDHFIVNKIWSYIIMDFASKRTLSDRLSDRKEHFKEKEAKIYTAQIAKALHYMHDHDFAHRDLKLANVLIHEEFDEEIIKVTDFGMSGIAYRKGIGSLMQSKAIGTTHYMSPNLIKIKIKENAPDLLGMKIYEYDPFEADMWALGVCIYEMLHAFKPFAIDSRPKTNDCIDEKDYYKKIYSYGESLLQMLNNQMTCDWKKNKMLRNDLSDDCKNILRGLLEPDKHNRYDIFILMRHKWLKGLTEDECIPFNIN